MIPLFLPRNISMHGCRTLGTTTCLVVMLCAAAPAMAQRWGDPDVAPAACQPRIKFLDDLLCWGRAASVRDPWEERIETDRHDFTQSATTVGRGVSQVEMGYTYYYLDEHEEIEHSHVAPELMLRVGLTDDIEFRLRWTYAWIFADAEEDVNAADSAEDLRWAFKLAVTDQDACIPESALEVRFTVPTGGSAFSTERVEFGLDYIYDWRLAEGCRFYGSSGCSTNALADFGLVPEEPAAERFMLWTQSFALGIELAERVTMYNEFYGLFSHALIDDYAIVIYNVGVDYYVTDDFLLDLRVGAGLTPDSDDFFSGVGGGFRF